MWAFHSPFFPREGEPDIPAITSSITRTQMVRSSGFGIFCAIEVCSSQWLSLEHLDGSKLLDGSTSCSTSLEHLDGSKAHPPDRRFLRNLVG